MSYSKEITVWCDGRDGVESCGKWTNGDGQCRTAQECRQMARSNGWVVSLPGGHDLCPDHADQASEFR